MRLKRGWEACVWLGFGSDVGVRSAGLMMSVHNGPLHRGWLDQVLRHMSWAQVRAASLGSKLGLDIDTLLEENAF